jgi:hypothetical protein
MIADWPGEIVRYLRETPSALEQSSELFERARQAPGGLFGEEGTRLLAQDPVAMGFGAGAPVLGGLRGMAARPVEPPGRPAGAQPARPATEVAPTGNQTVVTPPGAAAPTITTPTRWPGEPLRPPASGMAGNIRLSRIDAGENVKDVIRMDAELSGGDVTARRGVIPLQATQDMANDLGMTPEVLAQRMTGQAFNAEQVVAARNLMTDSATQVVNLAQQARGGSDADLAAFNQALVRHRSIQEQVSGITAEAGRALSAFRILAKSRDREQALKRIMEIGGGRERLEDIASAIATLPPEQVGRFVKDSFKITNRDRLQYLWINGLVSGPQTHAANILGNTISSLWQLPETAVAGVIGATRRGVFGGHGGVRGGEALARTVGLVQGVKDGALVVVESMKPLGQAGSKVDAPELARLPLGVSGSYTVGLPTRLLSSEDALFKAMASRAEINAQALRLAAEEGLSGDALAAWRASMRHMGLRIGNAEFDDETYRLQDEKWAAENRETGGSS